MYREDLGIFLAVISKGRPNNVGPMTEIIGQATWYIGRGESRYYKAAGAKQVWQERDGKLCQSRNGALVAATMFNAPCLQISDDCTGFEWLVENTDGKKLGAPMKFVSVVEAMKAELENSKLVGIAPTANAFYAKNGVSKRAFILGDLFLTHAKQTLRFDEEMTLKEDYDFTMQHIEKYGRVSRLDWLMGKFKHRTNSGGAVSIRTKEEELRNIEHLKKKWGEDIIRPSARGETEILLRIPK